ncbi:hypothetical protein ACE2AJ_08340 [Aquihabitans daechungensis]
MGAVGRHDGGEVDPDAPAGEVRPDAVAGDDLARPDHLGAPALA